LFRVLPRLDHDQYGWSPYLRIYRCLEGYVCVSCVEPEQKDSMHAGLGVRCDESQDTAEALQYVFFGQPTTAWVEALRDAGVRCAEVIERSSTTTMRSKRGARPGSLTPPMGR
jgi:hypothetical protein